MGGWIRLDVTTRKEAASRRRQRGRRSLFARTDGVAGLRDRQVIAPL